MVVELKCLDVDLLDLHKETVLKELRDIALGFISKFLKRHGVKRYELHVCIEKIYRMLLPEQQLALDDAVIKRTRKLASKAASQIESTQKLLSLHDAKRCMWVVNNNNLHIAGATLGEEAGQLLATKIARSALSKTSRLDFILVSNGMAFKNRDWGDVICLWSSHGFKRGEKGSAKSLSIEQLEKLMPNLCSAHRAIVDYCMSPEQFLFRQGGETQRNASADAWIATFKECVFYYGYEDEWTHRDAPFVIKLL